MNRNTFHFLFVFRTIAVVLAVLGIASCTAPLYDEQTDKAITALQQEVDLQLARMITLAHQHDLPASDKLDYVNNTDFYDKTDSALTVLKTRMLASPDPSAAKLGRVFDNIAASLDAMRKLHEQQNHLSEPFLVATRNQLNAQFSVLLVYELSLKSGSASAP